MKRKRQPKIIPCIAVCFIACIPTLWYLSRPTNASSTIRATHTSAAAPPPSADIRDLRSMAAYEAKGIGERLRAYIAIPSFSGNGDRSTNVHAAISQMLEDARANGADTAVTGTDVHPVGVVNFPGPSNAPVVLVYVHADVVADAAEHFQPNTAKDGRTYGRGATDDKGPAAVWLGVPDLFRRTGIALPVTLRIVIDGAEETGSPSVDKAFAETLQWWSPDKETRNAETTTTTTTTTPPPARIADGVIATLVSDSYCPDANAACLTASLRGVIAFELTARGAATDLHSGVHGGAVPEPLIALSHVISDLVSDTGRVTVEGVSDTTPSLSPAQSAMIRGAPTNPAQYAASIGLSPDQLLQSSGAEINAHRWLRPSISVHGFRGAWSGPGRKPVIPGAVTALLSVRVPPGQPVPAVVEGVCAAAKAAAAGTKVVLKCAAVHSADAWEADTSSAAWSAVIEGVAMAHGQLPDIVGGGGTISIVSRLGRLLPTADVVLLPMAAADTGAHSDAEFIRDKDLERGVLSAAAALTRLAKHYEEHPQRFKRHAVPRLRAK